MSKFKPQQQKIQFPFYKANLQAFKIRYPEYYDLVTKSPVNLDYQLIPSKIGLPNLHIKSLDRDYYENDIWEGAVNNFKTFDLRNAKAIVFLGFGLGYDPIYFAERISPQINTEEMIIIENDPSLVHMALKNLDMKAFIEQSHIKLLIGAPPEELFAALSTWWGGQNRYYNAKAYQIIYNQNIWEMNEKYYSMALNAVKSGLIYAVNNYGNCTEDSLIGVDNMLKNINVIINNPGINLLKDKFKGKPAVVIATGPSLNKNKHLLKGLENKALLIACDATLKILLGMSLKPHLVTSLEREIEVVQLFKGIKAEQVEDVYLAACPVVFNEVYQTFPGKNIIPYRKFDHFKWLNIDRGILDIKYSAGNMAFKVAEYLGCDPIILIGQDLALSRSGKTNAAGATLGDEQQSYLKEGRFMVAGNDGKPIETTNSLKLFLQAYEIDVAAYRGKCINSTEGGAFIVGTEVMPFAESIKKYITDIINPLGIIQESIKDFVPEEGIHERTLALIEHTIIELEFMKSCCEQGIQAISNHKDELEKLLKEPDEPRVNEIMQECAKYKVDMLRDHTTWQLFFAHIGQSYFLNFEIECKGVPWKHITMATAKAEITLMHDEYYKIIGDIIEVCLRLLREAREDLR